MPCQPCWRQVERYAREIVPAFNAYLYFRIGYWLGRKVSQGLYRVRLGYVDTEALARVPENATVVFVMNHRSNMDYMLAGYLAADQAALSYAVGEWARIWPLSALIRAMGAYFVRRNSKDELYRRVLERYIAMATEAGVPQAVFPEGGLTRDGLLREPRLGVHRLHAARLPPRRRARPGVRAARPQLRPRAGGPHAAAVERSRRAQAGRASGRSGTRSASSSNNLRLMLQQRLAPLRLCLRQLRHAGLDARVLRASAASISRSSPGDARRRAIGRARRAS